MSQIKFGRYPKSGTLRVMLSNRKITINDGYCAHLPEGARLTSPLGLVLSSDLHSRIQSDLHVFSDLISALNSRSEITNAFNSVVKRIKLLDADNEGAKAIYQLPLALAKLDFLIRKSSHPDVKELINSSNALIEKVVGYLILAASRRLPDKLFGERSDGDREFQMIGQGAGYWAFKCARSGIVGMVSKTSEKDSFMRLRQRWIMSRKLNELGQPKGLLVATTPFLHAFFEFAPGATIGDIYKSAQSTGQPQVLHQAAIEVGALVRRISELPVEGVGELIPRVQATTFKSKDRIWRGKFENNSDYFKAHESLFINKAPNATILEKIGIDILQFKRVAKWYKEVFGADTRRCLSHQDPHIRNYLYDHESKRVSVLDWERVVVAPEPVMLARIFQFWSGCSNEQKLHIDLFKRFMHGYEQDQDKRKSLIDMSLKASAVQQLLYLYRTTAKSNLPNHTSDYRTALNRLLAILSIDTL